ncbi:MAG: hypothetical protein J6B04_02440 [Clostridia bacterium]|nr:hypothetical protein [Clostridia bacterium]
MLVKNVIISALTALERHDICSCLKDGASLSVENAQTVETLMHCYNAVEDELARLYFPLIDEYETETDNGEVQYADFPNVPIKILAITANGKKVKFKLSVKHLKTCAKNVRVRYAYSPKKKTIEEQCEVLNTVGERLISYGVLAEYCLICGLLESAESWESKYREEIRALQNFGGGKIPQRSWV